MRDDLAKERAIGALNGYAQFGAIGNLSRREATDEEIVAREAEQKRWLKQHARREALTIALGLGRRYESAADAIGDAREIAAFVGLEIE